TIGAVAGISQEIALVGEDRFVLAILQRIYSGPTITAATAGKLQVNAVAATVGGRAGSDLRGIPLEVFAGDDVYHAGNCVGAVDRRSTAGQDLDALNDRGRNGAHVDHVVVAVIRLRVLCRATSVDQSQRVARAKVAQVDDLGVGCKA